MFNPRKSGRFKVNIGNDIISAVLEENPDLQLRNEEDLYHHLYSTFYPIASYILRNDDAEDVAAIVIDKVFKDFDQFDYRAKFSTWAYKIVTNEAFDYLRKKKVRGTIVSIEADIEDLNGMDHSPHYLADKGTLEQETINRDYVTALLSCLSEEDRQLLVLKVCDGYSVEELSKATGMNENTIKTRLFRARIKLVRKASRLCKKPVDGTFVVYSDNEIEQATESVEPSEDHKSQEYAPENTHLKSLGLYHPQGKTMKTLQLLKTLMEDDALNFSERSADFDKSQKGRDLNRILEDLNRLGQADQNVREAVSNLEKARQESSIDFSSKDRINLRGYMHVDDKGLHLTVPLIASTEYASLMQILYDHCYASLKQVGDVSIGEQDSFLEMHVLPSAKLGIYKTLHQLAQYPKQLDGANVDFGVLYEYPSQLPDFDASKKQNKKQGKAKQVAEQRQKDGISLNTRLLQYARDHGAFTAAEAKAFAAKFGYKASSLGPALYGLKRDGKLFLEGGKYMTPAEPMGS